MATQNNEPLTPAPSLSKDDKVEKIGGDYKFQGAIVCVFQKTTGQWRMVVEDDRGVLHIYSEKNLKKI